MAVKNTSVALGEPFVEFAGEDERIEALRAIIQKSLDSGPARPFDLDAFMERKFGPSERAL
jgi:Arc/MetJ-type ribon-helix-helix transcriptional regulator